MPSIIRGVPPRIADVQCSRLRFEPGDRVIVRHFVPLSVEQIRRLRKSVQKWAGCEVEVLFVDVTRMDVTVEKASEKGRIVR